MTNRELLVVPRERLSPAQRQRQALLRAELTEAPCPACRAPLSPLAAAGVDLDDWHLGQRPTGHHCPRCGVALQQAVAPGTGGPGWCWRLAA